MKLKKPYKLLDISITEETGFMGTYKKALGTFEDKSSPSKVITVLMPKQVTQMKDETINQMKSYIKKGKNPYFVVKDVTTHQRADGKGTYDVTSFKWQ